MAEPESKWSMDNLPEWAQEAIRSATASPREAFSVVDRGRDAWPLLLDAAVVSGFLPKQLAPGLLDGSSRKAAEQDVLQLAETTYQSESESGTPAVRWSLTNEARKAVLREARQAGDLEEALNRTGQRFNDPVTRALQLCLRSVDSEAPLREVQDLEAVRVAVGWLTGIQDLTLPPLEQIEREIELRRLLAPFERMTGASAPSPEGTRSYRFFGRTGEIETLRAYVGQVAADTFGQKFSRALDFVGRVFTGRKPLAVWGIGGVGKTTLISKFMLEHATAAASRYPFAYLDFDRPTMSPRRRPELLAEMCLQVGAQFDDLTVPMAALRNRIADVSAKSAASPEGGSISLLSPCLREFRDLVEGQLQKIESTFEWARPFLLIFDTFEVVQYTQSNVRDLEEFVRGFSKEDESELWPRLRLVISGRKEVTDFLDGVEPLPLEGLDSAGSSDMLVTLAADAGKPISSADADRLVSALAKAVGDPKKRVLPLRLRLIGDIFRSTTGTGPAAVDSLLKELSEPLSESGLAGSVLVDGVLVRRVLDHVVDKRVAALADPGLVVRRINAAVIQNVMTPATPNPADGRKPWTVSETEAKSIFEAFEKEVTLVEHDGNELKHRADVRREMLPLIRARSEEQFFAVHALAFEHFSSRARTSLPDASAAAVEAVYHGLWLNKPLDVLASLWPSERSVTTPIDPEEFPENSPARLLFAAKAGDPLPANEVETLPGPLALEWLEKRCGDLLSQRRAEDSGDVVAAASGSNFERLDGRPDLAAVVTRVLYRSGRWAQAHTVARRQFDRIPFEEFVAAAQHVGRFDEESMSRPAALLSIVRTIVTIEAKGQATGGEELAARGAFIGSPSFHDLTSALGSDLVKVELLAHAAVASGMVLTGRWADDMSKQIEASARRVDLDRWAKLPRVLRLAALTASHGEPWRSQYLADAERLPRDAAILPVLGRVLEATAAKANDTALLEIARALRSRSDRGAIRLLRAIDDVFWHNRSAFAHLLSRHDLADDFWLLVASDNGDWVRPLGNALTQALTAARNPRVADRLRRAQFVSRSSRQLDGLSIVEVANESGRLLELADLLVAMNDSGPYGKHLPSTARDVALALRYWHQKILARHYLATAEIAIDHVVKYNDDPKERYGRFVMTRGLHAIAAPLSFRIGIFPVTNAMFLEFVRNGAYQDDRFWSKEAIRARKKFVCEDRKTFGPATWGSGDPSTFVLNHPVAGVSYFEAAAFIKWLQFAMQPPAGFRWSLPTEDMWELAARGSDGRLYPWGHEYQTDRCNGSDAGQDGTTAVGAYPAGASPFGCQDMAGNVWEFVTSDDDPFTCVLRGGSFKNSREELKTSLRLIRVPVDHRPSDFGFRCALTAL